MVLWYLEGRRGNTAADRKRQRAMTREIVRPKTGAMTCAIVALLCAIALWVVAPPALAQEAAQYVVATDGDAVNVRTDPWLGAEITGYLPNGSAVTVLSTAKGWALVDTSVEAGSGYVSENYLTQCDAPTGEYQNVSGGPLNVRSEPGGARVRKVADGDTVTVTRWATVDSVDWGFVGDGYVKRECLGGGGKQ